MDELKPYSEYRDSALPWLEEIPAHWEICRNGQLFSERNETGYGSLPILEVSLRTGVQIRDIENLKRKQVMSDRNGYKRAAKGDIAYNMMRMWQGAVGVAPVDGLVSPAYVVARPFADNVTKYYEYLFRTTMYMNEVDGYSRGIVKDRNRLYWQDFKRMPSCRPPVEEQNIIVAFANFKQIQFSRFIRAKQRLIKLLNEQKQVIINQAVTKGINPNIKLKPSGMDYLGDIPEHWEVRRLRTIASVKASGVDKKIHEGEESVRLCNYVDAYKNDYITNKIEFMVATASSEEIKKFELKAGDIIITKDSESWKDIAVPAYVPVDLPGVICAYHLSVVRAFSKDVLSEFLFTAFCANPILDQFRVAANGVTRFGLSQGAIKEGGFPLPPMNEQKLIIDHVKEATSTLHQTISRTEREIELVREYQTRLIADVVIGKVDVRDIPVEITMEEPVPQEAVLEDSNDIAELEEAL